MAKAKRAPVKNINENTDFPAIAPDLRDMDAQRAGERGIRRLLTPGMLGVCFAFLVALVHPLAYEDYFYNINRIKFYLYIGAAFATFVLYAVLTAYNMRGAKWRAIDGACEKHAQKKIALSDIGMSAFVCISAISCAFSVSPAEALTGAAGRFSGLILILAMGAAYMIVSRARGARHALTAGLMLGGVACALLGILNFFMCDPLGFYETLGEKYVPRFISTIGNLDFFSAFLCLFLPAATVLSLTLKRPWARALMHVCALTGVGGVAVARADVALFGVLASAFSCALLSVSSRRAFGRALIALSMIPAGFGGIGFLTARIPNLGFDGNLLYKPLIQNYALCVWIAALVFALGMLFTRIKDRQTPARCARGMRICLYIAPVLFLCALFAVMYHFSVTDTQTALPSALRYLRFKDTWGSYRGGVWMRSLKLYTSFDIGRMLFGLGPDMLKQTLNASYGAEIAAYSGLVFDNAHNEYIQYLLTLGAAGLCAYLVFVGACLRALARAAKHNPAAAACLAAAIAYLVQAIFNVNQPETTPLLFLALSACAALGEEEKAGA